MTALQIGNIKHAPKRVKRFWRVAAIGSRPTVGLYFVRKGHGNFSDFGVTGKCVTNQILFLGIDLVDS